jgi:hypothetical protein
MKIKECDFEVFNVVTEFCGFLYCGNVNFRGRIPKFRTDCGKPQILYLTSKRISAYNKQLTITHLVALSQSCVCMGYLCVITF